MGVREPRRKIHRLVYVMQVDSSLRVDASSRSLACRDMFKISHLCRCILLVFPLSFSKAQVIAFLDQRMAHDGRRVDHITERGLWYDNLTVDELA